MKILIVEDDADIQRLIAENLTAWGMEFDVAGDGEVGLERALSGEYDLILLDVMLPKLDGFTICQRIREKLQDVQIIFVTARGEEVNRVLGLEYGADDYIIKPFSIVELRARINARLRRHTTPSATAAGAADGSEKTTFGEMVIDRVKRTVTVSGKKIPLTALEFDLLAYLAASPGVPYSREQLLEAVWGYSTVGYESNVTTHVKRIRAKIEPNPDTPIYIKTAHGVGYSFAEAQD